MPFTLSHPLFAVPLRKLAPALSVTGLVLGSMIPDMEYFVAMQPIRTIGHSLGGFFLMGIPLSTALAYAFHRVIMPALPHMLPSAWGMNRFAAHLRSEWSLGSLHRFLLFYVSLFIGFLTHLFVDGWTHRTGYYVEMFPVLRENAAYGFPGYWLLQQGLSLLGIGLPLLYLFGIWRSWRRNDKKEAHGNGQAFRRAGTLPVMAYALIALLTAGTVFAIKLSRAYDPFMLNLWFVAPFTSLLLGIYTAALLRTGRLNGKTPHVLCGMAAFALLFILLQVAKHSPALHGAPLWDIYIWLLSALIFILSKFAGSRPDRSSFLLHRSHSS